MAWQTPSNIRVGRDSGLAGSALTRIFTFAVCLGLIDMYLGCGVPAEGMNSFFPSTMTGSRGAVERRLKRGTVVACLLEPRRPPRRAAIGALPDERRPMTRTPAWSRAIR